MIDDGNLIKWQFIIDFLAKKHGTVTRTNQRQALKAMEPFSCPLRAGCTVEVLRMELSLVPGLLEILLLPLLKPYDVVGIMLSSRLFDL